MSRSPAEWLRYAREKTLLLPSQETIYRDLFKRDLARLGVEDGFYPVRGAASHGLMYLLARILLDQHVKSILEFGAGQTTLLLNQVALQRGGLEIVTIEHDAEWVSMLADKVGHDIIVAPQSGTGTPHGRSFYAGGAIPDRKFDLLIVDGPPSFSGMDRLARNGFADVFLSRLAEDFIIIVDDAERLGEARLIGRIRKVLRGAGIKFREGEAIGLKRQKIFASGTFTSAAFY